MKFAVEFFGPDHVMYGSDYPCWDPKETLRYFEGIGLSRAEQEQVLNANARRILQLDAPLREPLLVR